MVLKKLESKVGEKQIVRDNLAALISHSPPSPLGGFFGTTRVNDLASDLSDVYTLVHFLDEDSVKAIVIQGGSDQTRQIDLVYAEYTHYIGITKTFLRPSRQLLGVITLMSC